MYSIIFNNQYPEKQRVIIQSVVASSESDKRQSDDKDLELK